jgi:hypothetical protein
MIYYDIKFQKPKSSGSVLLVSSGMPNAEFSRLPFNWLTFYRICSNKSFIFSSNILPQETQKTTLNIVTVAAIMNVLDRSA